jgi:hypothetical protein
MVVDPAGLRVVLGRAETALTHFNRTNHTRESIEAHVTIVFAAHAVSHRIEHQTGWSIKKFVRTARRHRTVTIQA